MSGQIRQNSQNIPKSPNRPKSPKKNRTVFRVMVLPLLSILAVEMCVLAGSLVFGGVMNKLNQNARDMLAQQVENRGNYLVNDMIGNWSNLNLLSEEINAIVDRNLTWGNFSLMDLKGNAQACEALLGEIRPELIDTMYNKQVSGIFLVLNPCGPGETPDSLSGIYLRDLDPTSTPSQRNEDILTERAPVEVVRSGRIATDTGWQPVFTEEDMAQPFYQKPFQAAHADGGRLDAEEYGYWTTEPYCLAGDNRRAISYSVPLILDDGRIYGVLGVELLEDYMQSLLPCGELMENERGSYLLAVGQKGECGLKQVLFSGESMTAETVEELSFALTETEGREARDGSGKYYGAVKPLVVYSNNAPFDSDRWYLLGIGAQENLFAFSRQIQAILSAAFVLTLAIGLVGVLLVSYRLSKPIQLLSQEVEKAKRSNVWPVLPDTGIREIDQFSGAITELQREVADSSTRFLQIMDMASVDMAGDEIKEGSERVFVTDNFFPLLGREGVDTAVLKAGEFRRIQKESMQGLEHNGSGDGSVVYQVPLPDGAVRYLRFEEMQEGKRHVGLLEDVTTSTLERMRVERERDCDGLTKLYARRGFRRVADALFLKPDELKTAALLMIDLDNLKTTNDKFGHNFGDLYIQTAGRCFLENTPANTICARISGDEFLLLFYGYGNREEIREKIRNLYRAIGEVEFVLPNGNNMGLSASGGVAWYPEDSEDLSDLMKFSDFAMYQVKRSKKGMLAEFNAEDYREKMFQNQSRLEFNQMLESRKIKYHFQPIFHAVTGEPYAYEALMRADYPTLRSPETVLRLAREAGRMHEMEYLTLFCSGECYTELLERGEVSEQAYLFVNSIANVRMTEEEEREYHVRFARIQPQVVIEITEVEQLDMKMVEGKKSVEGCSGMFALDDYGSGYNSEINLLELKPHFVKVDITIVRDIDKDANKQQVVSNIVEYAHKRGMMVIMEGLETAAEVGKSLELGADLLQGYFLARPGEVPPAINEEAARLIRAYWEERK